MSTDHETLVKEYVRLREQRDQLDQAMDGIKEQLRGLDAGTHEIAGLSVQITPNRRLDTKLVEQKYPVTVHPMLYVAKPDPAALRMHLSPLAVDELMKEVGPAKVTIK